MDKIQRKILRSPTVKRRSKVQPVGQRLTLERVLGLTVSSNAAFSCDPVSGIIAYPAGCVVVLFNPRRNRQSHIFNVSKKTITSVAFSADGKHLVTGECGHQPAVRVWDVEEKAQVAEFHGHKFGINCVAFSPNLKFIVSIGSQHDMMVNVWNWRTGNKVASNKVSCKVNAVSFGADSTYFVTVGNRHVKFWYLDTSKSKINQTVPLLGRSGILGDQKNNFFCDVVCGRGPSSSSTYIITQSGLLCEFNEKRLLDKWVELRTKSANCITAGEEHIYIGCAEGVVRVFSASSLQFVATLPQPHHLGVEVATATSSSDMICLETDAKYPDVIAITVDDDHKKVACIYNDHSLYVWDVLNVRRVGKAWSFLFHSGCVWALEVYPRLENNQTGVLPPGSFLTASSDNTIRVWNLDPQMKETPGYKHNIYSNELLKVVYTDPAHTFLCDVDYNPAGATDKTDTTWEGKNGVRSIRVSPDGQHLASGDRQGNLRVYDLRCMSEIRCIEAHESDVVCLEYSYSKAGPKILASGSRDRLIHVFDVEQHYGLLQTLDDHSAAIQAVRFTDANNKLRMLSCGSDKSLLFRNASLNPGFEFNLDQHLVSKSTMYDMIIDPTQKFVATACQDRNVRVYNMETAKQKKNYRASLRDDGTLLRVQLDPSGTYAATSCTDKNLCVLEFYTGELTATVFGHSEIVTGLRFTNDLKHLISVSADGCIFVWRLSSEMTKTMRLRMEELGKITQDETHVLDRRDTTLLPKPVILNSTFTASSSDFPVMKESIPSTSNTSSLDPPPPSMQTLPFTFPATPVTKRSEQSLVQPSPANYYLSSGPLPNWAKAQLDINGERTDDCSDAVQPKGRWAQRFDLNLALKSQLDMSQMDEVDNDSKRFTGYEGGGLRSVEPMSAGTDLRRETVVLSQHLPVKNIPIIDDDDETNIDDDEDFAPAYLKGKILFGENDRSSTEHEERRRSRKSDITGLRLDKAGEKRWSNRFSLGNEDTASSFGFDDTDDQDAWSDTTKIIYPPDKPEPADPCDSTYQVYAASGNRKPKSRTASSVSAEEDSESTDHVSLEDGDDDTADEVLVSSSANTPSDPDRPQLARTPDKEQFLKENFESVSFTPIAMDKFAQQMATLENAATNNSQTSTPFSPRLSLSSRFLSRSQFVGVRNGGGTGVARSADNWFNPLHKTKLHMASAMDETRRRLTDMNLGTAGLLEDSPEKDSPPSPPTKLDSTEPSFSTPKSSSQGSLGACGSPSPRILRQLWAEFPLSYEPIQEEQPLPKIPIPRTLNHIRMEKLNTGVDSSFRSDTFVTDTYQHDHRSTVIDPTSHQVVDKNNRPLPSPDDQRSCSPRLTQSADGKSLGTPPQSPGLTTPQKRVSWRSTPSQEPELQRSLDLNSFNTPTGTGAFSQSFRLRRSEESLQSRQSSTISSVQSPTSGLSSPKSPLGRSLPRRPRTPLSMRPKHEQSIDSQQSPKPYKSPVSVRSVKPSHDYLNSRSSRTYQSLRTKPTSSISTLGKSSSVGSSLSSVGRSVSPTPHQENIKDSVRQKEFNGKRSTSLPSLRSVGQSPPSPGHSPTASPSPAFQGGGNAIGKSVHPRYRAYPAQPEGLGSEPVAAGKKLERDTSPIPSFPAERVPSSVTHKVPASSGQAAAPLLAKGKRLSGDRLQPKEGSGGTSAAAAPAPRQVPSYFRTTKSSRLKSSTSAGSLAKQAEAENSKAATGAEKKKGASKKRFGKNRLSSSRLSLHASSPNLTDFREDEAGSESNPTSQGSSNLCSLADISISEPDIVACMDDQRLPESSATLSKMFHGEQEKGDIGQPGTRTYSPSRRSMPASIKENVGLSLGVSDLKERLTDTQLMPPPSFTNLSTRNSLLRRAAQARKRSTSELSLEQAKSILLGNSGILGSQQNSPENESPSNSPPVELSVSSASCASVQQTVSGNSSTTSISQCSTPPLCVHSVSSPVLETKHSADSAAASAMGTVWNSEETVLQADHDKNQMTAEALNAVINDTPRCDQPSLLKESKHIEDVSSSTHITLNSPLANRVDCVSNTSEVKNSPTLYESVNGEQSLHITRSPTALRDTFSNNENVKRSPSVEKESVFEQCVSPVPQHVLPTQEQVVSPCSQSPEQRVSPRSQSDTGLGSDTDTDSDVHQYPEKQLFGDGCVTRGDRSRLSLDLQNSYCPEPAVPVNEALVHTCTSVVADLKLAVQNAKDFHSEVCRSNSAAAKSTHQQVMSSLSQAFHEAHLTLAELATQSPGASDGVRTPYCPLVAGTPTGGWDGALMDRARGMLQPFMWTLSRELTSEVVKVVKERLEESSPR